MKEEFEKKNAGYEDNEPDMKPLTNREKEIMKLMVMGYNNVYIGKILNISKSTAKAHVSSILSKLNTKSRILAVIKALKYNIANINDIDI